MYQLKTVFGVIPLLFKLMFFNSHSLLLNRRLIIVIIVFYLGFGSNTSVFIFTE